MDAGRRKYWSGCRKVDFAIRGTPNDAGQTVWVGTSRKSWMLSQFLGQLALWTEKNGRIRKRFRVDRLDKVTLLSGVQSVFCYLPETRPPSGREWWHVTQLCLVILCSN